MKHWQKKAPSKKGQIVYKKGISSNLGKVVDIIKDRRDSVRLKVCWLTFPENDETFYPASSFNLHEDLLNETVKNKRGSVEGTLKGFSPFFDLILRIVFIFMKFNL